MGEDHEMLPLFIQWGIGILQSEGIMLIRAKTGWIQETGTTLPSIKQRHGHAHNRPSQ